MGQGLLQKLSSTGEMPDGDFDRKRDLLVWEIQDELKKFCKTK
jgi:hypothetical protein